MAEEIREVHGGSGGTYGSPRVTAELRERGRRVNEKRVARQVLRTSVVRSVLRTVAHAAAVGAVVCLYGDAGQGKTVALQYDL
ncbi:IS3 family transposase [Streptomyces griseoluteus]|uniref:IS3 family transposase n=1 Tax=Streptomyces griseoluteus TaxID=29306 RepID=UPI0036E2E171